MPVHDDQEKIIANLKNMRVRVRVVTAAFYNLNLED